MWRFLRRRGYFNHSNREKLFLNLPFTCSPAPLWGSSSKGQSFPPLLREFHLLWGTKKDPAETRRQNTEAWGFSPSFLWRIMWDQPLCSSSCSHTLGSGRLPLSPSSPAGLPLACSARRLFEKAVGAIKWNRPAINSLSETRLLSPFISIRVFFFTLGRMRAWAPSVLLTSRVFLANIYFQVICGLRKTFRSQNNPSSKSALDVFQSNLSLLSLWLVGSWFQNICKCLDDIL